MSKFADGSSRLLIFCATVKVYEFFVYFLFN